MNPFLLGLSYDELDKMTDSMTDKQIAESLGGCSKNNVGYYRRKLGVKSYGEKNDLVVGVKGVPNPSNRKYFFDQRFFANIDSEIKAYALGLFFTDGHITKELHRARLSLTLSDSMVLEQIASEAKLDNPLLVTKPSKGNYQVEPMASLNFNSSELVKDLIALGLSPSKDNNTKLPSIDPALEKHLLRGIIDGDGTIPTVHAAQRSFAICELSGREAFLESVNEMLARHQLPLFRITKMKSIHRGRISINDFSVLHWCYEGEPSICIKRKQERYLDLCSIA
jgi:hypothetical protein